MLAPKMFFREMDELLRTISQRQRKSGDDLIVKVVFELEERIGRKLHFSNGRIYRKKNEIFFLVNPERTSDKGYKTQFSIDSGEVRKLLQYGSYIFENGKTRFAELVQPSSTGAFSVQTSRESWIVVFDLDRGWKREEISFCFNAIGAALTHRVVSESFRYEMEQAAEIQQTLLPIAQPGIEGYDICGRSQSAELVGGDFYDYFNFSPDTFGVVIGDSSGHGLPAALLVRDVITGLRMGLSARMQMIAMLTTLNKVIQQNTFSSRFVSLFYGEINRDGHFTYVNAGHPPPLLLTNGAITELHPTGPILGALPEARLHLGTDRLAAGSVLLLYSDGLTERTDAKGQQFGVQRLKELFLQERHRSALELQQLIFQAVYEFGNEEKWGDDISLVAIKKLQ